MFSQRPNLAQTLCMSRYIYLSRIKLIITCSWRILQLCFKASPSEAFHMEISFIHTQILVPLHVNKTNFHMKGFAQGLALRQKQNATCKSSVVP